ncbi:TniQ family protein [Paraburkholderia lycopersici]|uniref:TniQ protein n=1 Tax=Paraburkholderia lycopersici TaxID=416944 RepID=A0A1G6MN31_9BURK|nr:TniQ family protein [Paraburkholderia lycopersici]SDC56988.1 TniQ protein [Paraburkholderia lycopersici]
MSGAPTNPRSELHALEPIGLGTPAVESLLSYLCRLAVSHSVSMVALSRKVASTMGWEISGRDDWSLANICGMGDAANNWSAALSAMTGVERLDNLTLLPWRDVVSQLGLTNRSSRWCRDCFAQDKADGRLPYFRLAWTVNEVTGCPEHKTELVNTCPDCGRTEGRRKSAYVVPGWCSHCGAFLGAGGERAVATPEALWKANQVGAMLAMQPTLAHAPEQDVLRSTIQHLITRLDNGKSAHFAERIGLNRATVHHWMKSGGCPGLSGHLRIASQTGLSLPKVLTGDISGWTPVSASVHQLALLFPEHGTRSTPRTLDCDKVRTEMTAMARLPTPISVAEVARRLDINLHGLYRNANREARVLSERWKQYMKRKGEQSIEQARSIVEAACLGMVADGQAVNLRSLKTRLTPEEFGKVQGAVYLLQEFRDELT